MKKILPALLALLLLSGCAANSPEVKITFDSITVAQNYVVTLYKYKGYEILLEQSFNKYPEHDADAAKYPAKDIVEKNGHKTLVQVVPPPDITVPNPTEGSSYYWTQDGDYIMVRVPIVPLNDFGEDVFLKVARDTL